MSEAITKKVIYVRPIKPGEATAAKAERMPPQIIEAFNQLIAERMTAGGVATVKQDEVIALILSKLPDVKRQDLFDKQWLDVEDIYRKVGWKVEYDKPCRGDDYPAYFKFIKP